MPLKNTGQGIAWDRSARDIIYGIIRGDTDADNRVTANRVALPAQKAEIAPQEVFRVPRCAPATVRSATHGALLTFRRRWAESAHDLERSRRQWRFDSWDDLACGIGDDRFGRRSGLGAKVPRRRRLSGLARWIQAGSRRSRHLRRRAGGANGVGYDQGVVNSDRGQGVFSQSFLEFAGRMVAKYRMDQGRQLLKKHNDTFDRIERDYGVPGPVIVAFWGWRPISAPISATSGRCSRSPRLPMTAAGRTCSAPSSWRH